jgi:hypothetical protein
MRVGVLFNGEAGGAPGFPAIAAAILEGFHRCDLITCDGGYGSAWLPRVRARPAKAAAAAALLAPASATPSAAAASAVSSSSPSGTEGFVPRLRAAVASLVDAGIDLLVSVGGDGFAAYCAEVLIARGGHIPILGVAGGTANVGQLVRFDAASLASLEARGSAGPVSRIEDLARRPVHALECRSGARMLGLAFHDIVIGDTFLGTLEGRMVSLDAREFLTTGRKVQMPPSGTIVGPGFCVRRGGTIVAGGASMRGDGAPHPASPPSGGAPRTKDGDAPEVSAPGEADSTWKSWLHSLPRQIVASPLADVDFYRGKAALGVLCNAPWQEAVGVLALCDRSWVSMEPAEAAFYSTAQLLLGPEDRIELEGLCDSAMVIIDGNPWFREPGAVQIACRPAVIDTIVQHRNARVSSQDSNLTNGDSRI